MSKNMTDHELFWLARYAHNTLSPLFSELRKIEPSIHVTIASVFTTKDSLYNLLGGVSVDVHWARDSMFLQSSGHSSKEDIDRLAVRVKADIENLKLEVVAA